MVARSDGFHHLKYYLAESNYGGTIIHSQFMTMSGMFGTLVSIAQILPKTAPSIVVSI